MIIRFLTTVVVALALTTGAWAQCGKNGNQGKCPRGEGKGNPAECQNPKCPRTQGGGGNQQGQSK
ncbi:MAG: hypothetical protein SGI92_20230 [Bryobacteraceae bacterium]|nr:hypothetical protein [Bryobacteraceae bacterium]